MPSTSDVRNWLERLRDKIPGYGGYVDRERRRDIDKLHRERLADRLRGIKVPLTDIVRELSSSGRLMEVGPLDRLQSKIDRLENRIRFATYGYSGFFDVVKIEEPQLNSIYQFDLELVDHVDRLEAMARDLKNKFATAASLKAAAGEFETAVDEVSRTFDNRHSAIDKFGQDQPPGRPLFSS
jgi:hypothetical protein